MNEGNTGCGCGCPSEDEKKFPDLEDFRARVEVVLDKVRPALQMDGGDCRLVEVTHSGDVILQLVGACAGCAMSTMTLKMGIERALKDEIPGMNEVHSVQM